MKKLVSLLLAACILMCLLPLAALATGEEKAFLRTKESDGLFTTVNLDAKKGTITYAITDADGYLKVIQRHVTDDKTYDYNVKLDYTGEKPILYLKNAHLGRFDESRDVTNAPYDITGNDWLTAERYRYTLFTQGFEAPVGDYAVPDVVIEADSSITSATECLVFRGSASVTSVDGATLTLRTGSSGICIMGKGETLTINANLDIVTAKQTFATAAQCISATNGANVVIAGGTIHLVSETYSAINVVDGNLNITGGDITAVAKGEGQCSCIHAGGDITVADGALKVSKPTQGGGAGIASGNGNITISGGAVYAEGWSRAMQTNDSGKLVISGGALEAKALNDENEYMVFGSAPDLSGYGTYDAYVGMDEGNAEFYSDPAQLLHCRYFRITPGTGSTTVPTTVPTEATEPTTVPTTAPTQTTESATVPSVSVPQPDTDNSADRSLMVLAGAALLIAVVSVIAMVRIVRKRK